MRAVDVPKGQPAFSILPASRFGLRVGKNLDWNRIQYVESNYLIGFCAYVRRALQFALLVLAVELLISRRRAVFFCHFLAFLDRVGQEAVRQRQILHLVAQGS